MLKKECVLAGNSRQATDWFGTVMKALDVAPGDKLSGNYTGSSELRLLEQDREKKDQTYRDRET
jgi:hypothetical protein